MKEIQRLDDVQMDEVHLTTPVSAEAIRSLKLGDVVYLSGALYTAREGVYRLVVDKGQPLPAGLRELTNVNFHCSPAASVRPDGSYSVEAVTATASFRFGKSMAAWFERSGAKVIVGKAGLTELAYREWFVPHGAVYLTTVGYGLGAMYGRSIKRVLDVHWLKELGIAQACWVLEVEKLGPFLVEGDAEGRSLFAMYGRSIKRVLDVHWLKELGIAQACWVLEVEKLGPFLVEGDAEGRSLFAIANREINVRIEEVYKTLPPPALSRFGEILSRKDEVI